MSTSVWQGSRVRLRAVEPSDWEVFFAWNQDDDMPRRLDYVWFPQSREAVKRWAEEAATRRPQDDAFHFVIEDHSGEVVGSIATHDCDRRVGGFSYGLNVRSEHRRKGYAADAITVLLRYYFRELRYQKANARVYSFNEASMRLHEKLGFQREGRLRRMAYTEGRHHDVLLFGMTAEEFEVRTHHA